MNSKGSASRNPIADATVWNALHLRQIRDTITDIKSGGNMDDLKVTLKCGCEVDFTTKLDEPIQFVGTFERLLVCWQSTNEDVREAAFEEIQKRAIEYAHKALAGYNMRARMADEAVKLLIVKLVDKLAEE